MEENKESQCAKHSGCHLNISERCFWPPCVRIGCHTQAGGDKTVEEIYEKLDLARLSLALPASPKQQRKFCLCEGIALKEKSSWYCDIHGSYVNGHPYEQQKEVGDSFYDRVHAVLDAKIKREIDELISSALLSQKKQLEEEHNKCASELTNQIDDAFVKGKKSGEYHLRAELREKVVGLFERYGYPDSLKQVLSLLDEVSE